jgi:L-fuculose-phosphate aldolase
MSDRRERQGRELALRRQICEIGRRLYARGYVSGTDGNISCRLEPDVVLCTPTLISKGFMRPADLCKVDLEGRLLGGRREPTSEIRVHLALYESDPNTGAVVHSHSPYALAFAISGRPLPRGILPEVELFLGKVVRVRYETPGSRGLAELVRRIGRRGNAALLANHGAVTWAADLERAWWYTELLEAYCRVLAIVRGLGPLRRLPPGKLRELLKLRAQATAVGAGGPGVARERRGTLRLGE